MNCLIRKNQRTIGLLIGILRSAKTLVGVEEDSTCPKCEKDEDTLFHFLGECEGYERFELKILKASISLREELKTLTWTDILSLIRSGSFRPRRDEVVQKMVKGLVKKYLRGLGLTMITTTTATDQAQSKD